MGLESLYPSCNRGLTRGLHDKNAQSIQVLPNPVRFTSEQKLWSFFTWDSCKKQMRAEKSTCTKFATENKSLHNNGTLLKQTVHARRYQVNRQSFYLYYVNCVYWYECHSVYSRITILCHTHLPQDWLWIELKLPHLWMIDIQCFQAL